VRARPNDALARTAPAQASERCRSTLRFLTACRTEGLGCGITGKCVAGTPGAASPAIDITSDERPVHRVTVSSFWIDRYPVTVARYGRFVEAHKEHAPGGLGRATASSELARDAGDLAPGTGVLRMVEHTQRPSCSPTDGSTVGVRGARRGRTEVPVGRRGADRPAHELQQSCRASDAGGDLPAGCDARGLARLVG
jgi:hypothetical protein